MRNWFLPTVLLIGSLSSGRLTEAIGATPAPAIEPVQVTIEATDFIASESGPSTGLFTVHRTGATTDPLSVTYRSGGTAASPSDYLPLSGVIVIPAGSATATILVTPVDDAVAEEEETVILRLTAPPVPLSSGVATAAAAPAYQVGKASSATLTIKDNDLGQVLLPTVNIAASDATAAEPGSVGKITLSRLGSTAEALQVDWELVTGPISTEETSASSAAGAAVSIPAASNGVDYQTIAASALIPRGKSSVTITIQPIDDQLIEGREHVTLKVKPSALYNINQPDAATVFLADNDPVNLPPTIKLVAPTNGQTFVALALIPVAAEAIDAEGFVKTVEFFANKKSLGVTTNNPLSATAVNPFQLVWKDAAIGEYSLTAKATDDRGATATSAAIKIKVTRPIPSTVSIVASDPEALESDTANPGAFQVTRTGSLLNALNVHYSVSGTAENGVDYQKLSGILPIPVGEASALIPVVPVPDKALEKSEVVIVTLVPLVFAQPITIAPPPPEENYVVGNARSASVTIYEELPNRPPKVAIVSPKNGAVFEAGANITILAEVTDSDGTTREVAFTANERPVGSATTAPFSVNWNGVQAGSYALRAKATDDDSAATTSAPIHVTVTEKLAGIRLISAGAVWKYLDNGSDQGTAWRATVFDDSKWAAGPAPLGYGDGDEATVVGFGTDPGKKHITTYFRRAFAIEHAADYSNLVVRLLRDDGAVVYLNGTEIARNNMPKGNITSATKASDTVNGAAENNYYLAKVDPKLLGDGANEIAVEVHQVQATSSDLSFDLDLTGNAVLPDESPLAKLAITSPKDGASFRALADIKIEATAVDAKGYIPRLEFYANDVLLGVSQIAFIRAPDPGTLIQHTLDWKNVAVGKYTLVVKGQNSAGTTVTSAPVTITVQASSTTIRRQSLGNGHRVVFDGEIGKQYSIEVSSDLREWIGLGTIESTTGTFEFVDPLSQNADRRFYRAVPVE